MESGGHRLPRPGVLLVVFSIIALLLVVALASRPDAGIPQPALGPEPGRVVLDTVFYLLICAGLLGLLAALWALWPNPDLEMQPVERRRVSLGLALLASLAVLGLVWARNHWGRLPGLAQGQTGGTGAPGSLAPSGLPVYRGGDWVAVLITVVVLVGTGILLWWRLRPRRHGPRLAGRPGARIGEVLDDAVGDVLAEQDPRRAVIAAWARMERVLAAHGHARRPAETPFEYAGRAFVELGMAREALEGFAALYEWARFSVNQVTPGMREEALGRLLAVRESIRVVA